MGLHPCKRHGLRTVLPPYNGHWQPCGRYKMQLDPMVNSDYFAFQIVVVSCVFRLSRIEPACGTRRQSRGLSAGAMPSLVKV